MACYGKLFTFLREKPVPVPLHPSQSHMGLSGFELWTPREQLATDCLIHCVAITENKRLSIFDI
jgi:hypothetical protein